MTLPSSNARLRPFRPVPFGRYTLLSPLAVGGMGEIFLARLEGPQGFEKLCVIKKILPALANDPEFVDRFVNEAKILVKLSHGSIAQVLDVGLVEGDPYMALEYVDGKDLRKLAARARERDVPLPLTFILHVTGRVLDALAYAHRKRDEDDRALQLVHRDVSPQNILISYEGEVKVIDFGLAKSSLNSARTNPSMIMGKFLYMSPEQARQQPVDRRADLYAVGLCLYELVAGRNAFDDVPPHDLITSVAQPAIAPIRDIDPLCPPAVQEMIATALEVDPNRRFQSAEEFRARIQACLLEIDPGAGPESVSRYMRETFAAEYQQERKLLGTLRTAVRPPAGGPPLLEKARNRETAVFELKSVVPPTASASPVRDAGGAEAAEETLDPVPLSFANAADFAMSHEPPTAVDGQTVPVIVLRSDLEAMMAGTERRPAEAVPWTEGAPVGSAAHAPGGMFGDTTAPMVEREAWSNPDADFHIDLDGTSPDLPSVAGVAVREQTQPRVVVDELSVPAAPAAPMRGRSRASERPTVLTAAIDDDLEITVREEAAVRDEVTDRTGGLDAHSGRWKHEVTGVTSPAVPLVGRIARLGLLSLSAVGLIAIGAWLWIVFGPRLAEPKVTSAPVAASAAPGRSAAAVIPVEEPPAMEPEQVPDALLSPLEATAGAAEVAALPEQDESLDPVRVAAQVKEIREDWALAQRTFKSLRRRHGCGSRLLRAICARVSVLAPEMSELEEEPARLQWVREEVRTLRDELRVAARRGR